MTTRFSNASSWKILKSISRTSAKAWRLNALAAVKLLRLSKEFTSIWDMTAPSWRSIATTVETGTKESNSKTLNFTVATVRLALFLKNSRDKCHFWQKNWINYNWRRNPQKTKILKTWRKVNLFNSLKIWKIKTMD